MPPKGIHETSLGKLLQVLAIIFLRRPRRVVPGFAVAGLAGGSSPKLSQRLAEILEPLWSVSGTSASLPCQWPRQRLVSVRGKKQKQDLLS